MGIFSKKPGKLLLSDSHAFRELDRANETNNAWDKHRDAYIPRKKDMLTADVLFSNEISTGKKKKRGKGIHTSFPYSRLLCIIVAIIVVYIFGTILWIVL